LTSIPRPPRQGLAILQDRFAALSGSIGPVLNRLGDDIEGIGAQLRELLVLQAQANKAVRETGGDTPVDEATALASMQAAYRELIVQALRQQVVRVEQRFGERIQVILDRITYPMEAVSVADLVGREESAAH
jgi:hypothetical protein